LLRIKQNNNKYNKQKQFLGVHNHLNKNQKSLPPQLKKHPIEISLNYFRHTTKNIIKKKDICINEKN
jgi:hypothetical protein